MVLPLYANLEKHDPALLDAAQDLGANAWQRFWRVTFPLSLPGVFAGVGAGVHPRARHLRDSRHPRRHQDDRLIGNVIKQQFLDTRDWPFGSVLSMVLTVIAVLAVAGGSPAWLGAAGVRAVRRSPLARGLPAIVGLRCSCTCRS